MTTKLAPIQPKTGWILYDRSCGFCSRWIPWWAPTLETIGIDVAPLQEPWVRERTNLSDAEIVSDIRLLLVDNTLVSGGDVYRFVMRRLWWAYPLYLLSIAPGIRQLFDLAYRIVRKNRYSISTVCGLRGTERSGKTG